MRFTSENAREMARRGNDKRWHSPVAEEPPECPATIPAIPEPDPGVSLACVRERLEALDKRMASAETDREWDNLSRAYERMFRVWCTLTRTPGPGQLKPQAPRAPRKAYSSAPLPQEWESAPSVPPATTASPAQANTTDAAQSNQTTQQ